MPACHCKTPTCGGNAPDRGTRRAPARSSTALCLSILVAFFPKCPVCWAAYSSWLSIVGIFPIPYMGFMFPVLTAILGMHLLLLFRQSVYVGYGPFLISISGAFTLLFVRHHFPQAHSALNGGILLVLGGSFWNSFSVKQRKTRPQLATNFLRDQAALSLCVGGDGGGGELEVKSIKDKTGEGSC